MQRNEYVPGTVEEIVDMLSSMLLSAPNFEDAYFADRTIDSEFDTLKTALARVQTTVGNEKYQLLVSMADKMRAHFEADQSDVTNDSLVGRDIILEMQELLISSKR